LAREPVKIVTAEAAGAQATRVAAELARAGHRAEVAQELTSPDGLIVLLDDASLPEAVARLIQLLPGRATFPNVVLVMEQPSGGLLAEGFRDIVKPADAGAAVDALVRNAPPVLMTRLRQEVVGDFLPKFLAEMRQRAREKQALARDCIDLVRASAFLEKRLFRLHKLYQAQAIDELLVMEGEIDSYLATLDERVPARLTRLPAFPVTSASAGALGKREPRYRRAREEIEEAIDWLRQAGLLPALGKAGLEAMAQTAETLKGKPLQGLRDLRSIVEREIALRLSLIERIQTQTNAIAVLEERCLERHGFGVLPPGICVPESVHLIVRTLAQPPAEIYVTYCLDLRDLRLKPCADVLGEVARDLAWTREPRRAVPPPAPATAPDARGGAPAAANPVKERELR
jgi:hypothetical protein